MAEKPEVGYRLRIRVYSEPSTVPDEEALLETLVSRHLNRLGELSSASVRAWVVDALCEKYRDEFGIGQSKRGAAASAPTGPRRGAAEVESAVAVLDAGGQATDTKAAGGLSTWQAGGAEALQTM